MNRPISKTSNATSPISRPSHYNAHPSGIECIQVAQAFNFNLGNVIKYVWRCGLKAGSNPIKDLRKAIQYLEFEIQRLEAQDEQG